MASARTLAWIDALAWVLIYGGLFAIVLGIASHEGQQAMIKRAHHRRLVAGRAGHARHGRPAWCSSGCARACGKRRPPAAHNHPKNQRGTP
jgi:hypothetical protein